MSAVSIKYNQKLTKRQEDMKVVNQSKRRLVSKEKKKQNCLEGTVKQSWQALRRLSFSFYGEETMKRSKQIIFDQCDVLAELPEIANQQHKIMKNRRHNPKATPRTSLKKQKHSVLAMEDFFLSQKCDEIDIVPTNASQEDPHSFENTISRVRLAVPPDTAKNISNVTPQTKASNRCSSTPKSGTQKAKCYPKKMKQTTRKKSLG